MHCPVVAVSRNAVARLVPRSSEYAQVTAHPFQYPRLLERFHYARTLRRDKHNERTILVLPGRRGMREVPRQGAIGAVRGVDRDHRSSIGRIETRVNSGPNGRCIATSTPGYEVVRLG